MLAKRKIEKRYPELKSSWQKKVNKRGNYQKPNERLFNAVKQINKLSQYSCNALDIGCNCGILSVAASYKFKKVIGIDTDRDSKSVIKKAKIAANFFHRQNCSFHKMGFFKYVDSGKFEHDKIKAILGFQVLYHLDDDEIFMLKQLLPDIKILIISVRPEVGDRIEPGKPANKLGLYTIKQATDYFSPFFTKIKVRNLSTRWPTLIITK